MLLLLLRPPIGAGASGGAAGGGVVQGGRQDLGQGGDAAVLATGDEVHGHDKLSTAQGATALAVGKVPDLDERGVRESGALKDVSGDGS